MNTDKTFYFNRGIKTRVEGEVQVAAIELFKVEHIDLDNAIKGYRDASNFVSPREEGFIYLNSLTEVADAYEKGELYVVEGNW